MIAATRDSTMMNRQASTDDVPRCFHHHHVITTQAAVTTRHACLASQTFPAWQLPPPYPHSYTSTPVSRRPGTHPAHPHSHPPTPPVSTPAPTQSSSLIAAGSLARARLREAVHVKRDVTPAERLPTLHSFFSLFSKFFPSLLSDDVDKALAGTLIQETRRLSW